MRLREAQRLPFWAPVRIDAGKDTEQRARLSTPDAKWTEDMRGMAVVHLRDENDETPSWVHDGRLLIPRRQLTAGWS